MARCGMGTFNSRVRYYRYRHCFDGYLACCWVRPRVHRGVYSGDVGQKGWFVMPIYEWKCAGCGKVQENVQLSGDPIVPQCCGAPMVRQYGTLNVNFKGTGWATPKPKDPNTPSGLL